MTSKFKKNVFSCDEQKMIFFRLKLKLKKIVPGYQWLVSPAHHHTVYSRQRFMYSTCNWLHEVISWRKNSRSTHSILLLQTVWLEVHTDVNKSPIYECVNTLNWIWFNPWYMNEFLQIYLFKWFSNCISFKNGIGEELSCESVQKIEIFVLIYQKKG